MAAPRQQRAPNWRGQVMAPARRYVPDIAPYIAQVVGSVVTIGLIDPTGVVTVTAIPAWTLNGNLPVAAVLSSESSIDLDYGFSFGQGFTIDIPALSPQVRTNTGAYVAPAHMLDPRPPVPQIQWVNASGPLGAEVNLNYNLVDALTFTTPLEPPFQMRRIIAADPDAAEHTTVTLPDSTPVLDVPPGQTWLLEWNGVTWTTTNITV